MDIDQALDENNIKRLLQTCQTLSRRSKLIERRMCRKTIIIIQKIT
jgi:hypothetical protein